MGTRGIYLRAIAKAPSGSWLKIFANKPNAQARPLCYTAPPCRQPFITVLVAVVTAVAAGVVPLVRPPVPVAKYV